MMFTSLRRQMVQKWILDAGITDSGVIEAMRKVPRHEFVEEILSHQAYTGSSLPIGFGQTISHPTTVAVMSEVAEIDADCRILEVGTGSGYQAAVLAEMGANVFTVERIPELAARARRIFEKLGYYSIAVRVGDGSIGWNQHSPYDRIIVTAGSPKVPKSLLRQLKDGGRLIIPILDDSSRKLAIITREGEEMHIREAEFRNFVPLIGKEGWSGK